MLGLTSASRDDAQQNHGAAAVPQAAVYETLLDEARYPATDEIEKTIRAVMAEVHRVLSPGICAAVLMAIPMEPQHAEPDLQGFPPEPEYEVGGGLGGGLMSEREAGAEAMEEMMSQTAEDVRLPANMRTHSTWWWRRQRRISCLCGCCISPSLCQPSWTNRRAMA